MREHHTAQSLNAWLDSPAGETLAVQQVLGGQYAPRHAAAAAMAEREAQDRQWRRAQAQEKFERYPDRYESPSHAMRDVAEPAGGGGTWITASVDEIVAAGRYVNPAAGWRNLGGELPDGASEGVVSQPGRQGLAPADTRPPWRR